MRWVLWTTRCRYHSRASTRVGVPQPRGRVVDPVSVVLDFPCSGFAAKRLELVHIAVMSRYNLRSTARGAPAGAVPAKQVASSRSRSPALTVDEERGEPLVVVHTSRRERAPVLGLAKWVCGAWGLLLLGKF
jgi:hypothetical protein